MSKYLVYALVFAAGFLSHVLYTTIYFGAPAEFRTDFDYRLSSSFYNSHVEVCELLSKKNCGCNLVIETEYCHDIYTCWFAGSAISAGCRE